MISETDTINEIRKAIVENCFIVEDAVAISSTSEINMGWLFDLRAVFLTPTVLSAYSELFWERHKDKQFQICGVELAAVPLITAIILNFHKKGRTINGFIIRKSRKKTGLLKNIEGKVTNEPVIILDDLINSGGSVMRQVEIVREFQLKIIEVFTILRFRDVEYYKNLNEAGVPIYSLFDLNDFRDKLGVSNLPPPQVKTQICDPFYNNALWYFKGLAPNFFYVVPKSGPVASGGRVFFGTDDGTFFAINAGSGDVVWKYKIPFGTRGKFIFSTPSIYKNLVFFGAYDGNLYALNQKTGKREWVFMEADWIGSSPCVAIDLGLVFVGLEFGLFKKRGGVVAINASTGEKVWEYRTPELTHGSPAYSSKYGVVACGSNDGKLSVFDAKTGKLVWDFQTEGDIKYAPTFSDKHGVVVVLGHGAIVYVLDIKTGRPITTYAMDFGGYSSPLIIENTIICTSFDKHVHSFEIMTGKPIWKFNTGARCFATPNLIQGKVYVGSNNGRLFELDPVTGNVEGIFYTRERIVNKIAYDEETHTFFVPTFANELYALKKRVT